MLLEFVGSVSLSGLLTGAWVTRRQLHHHEATTGWVTTPKSASLELPAQLAASSNWKRCPLQGRLVDFMNLGRKSCVILSFLHLSFMSCLNLRNLPLLCRKGRFTSVERATQLTRRNAGGCHQNGQKGRLLFMW